MSLSGESNSLFCCCCCYCCCCCRVFRRIISGQSIGKILIIILSFRTGTKIKIKILIIEVKKLLQLCQQKLNMKLTTSLYSVIQQVHQIFVFSINFKGKDQTGSKINSKKMFTCAISFIFILICRN